MTIKIKRVIAWNIYGILKNIPPKDYPTTGEIKNTINLILPALGEHIGEYTSMVNQVVELNKKIVAKEIEEEKVKVESDKINEDWRNYNVEHGIEIVDVELNDEGFRTLKEQFDREEWGKKWVANIEEFGELVDAFSEAEKK